MAAMLAVHSLGGANESALALATTLSAQLTTFYIDPKTECKEVHHYKPGEQCAFVRATDKCGIEDGLVNYTEFIYCALSPSLLPLAIILLLAWLAFLFIAMAVSADDFFCPPLVVIARVLRMSDNIAGVTLLALGNGAPDVFSAVAAIRNSHDGEIGLAVGALMGAGVFVTTVVAGTVCVISPFHMAERPFLRDVIFFIGATYLTYLVLHTRHVTLVEAVSYVLLYVFYVVVVVLGRYIYRRFWPLDAGNRPETYDTSGRTRDVGNPPETYDTSGGSIDDVIPEVQHNPLISPINADSAPLMGAVSEVTPLLRAPSELPPTGLRHPLRQFLREITPLDTEQFSEARIWGKVYLIFKAPALFVLTFAIPVVDTEKPRDGWQRHLASLQCITAPLLTLAVSSPEAFTYRLGGHFPMYALLLLVGTALGVVTFLTSRYERPPPYHMMFAFVGFVAAVMWIEAIATEIVNLLTTVGIVFNLSTAILGITLLAWGNSIADYIADIAMAKNGFPRAGFSACYGGPLFNLLLGIGIPFSIKCWQSGASVPVLFTRMQAVLTLSLLVVLAVTLVVVPLLRFNVGRVFGGSLLGTYALFMVVVVMTEMGVFGHPREELSW